MKFLKISLILSAFALFIFACSQAANNTANNAANNNKTVSNTNSPTSTPTDEIAVGKTVYTERCVICHRDNGTGGKVTIEGKTINADNFTIEKMKNMSDEKYVGYIENGVIDEGMPAFKGKLTDAEIKSVINYIRKEFQSK